MNRLFEELKRKREKQTQKEFTRQEIEADIKEKAELCRKFINDEKYIGFRLYWEDIIFVLQAEYQNLVNTVKDNDELIRKAVQISTQIQTIKWFLNEPLKFIELETKTKDEVIKE